MKNILFVIAPEFFRDEELLEPKKILEQEGHRIQIASVHKGICTGKLGTKVNSDLSLEEVNPHNFDAIVFVGGSGALDFIHNHDALDLINDFYGLEKVIGAICVAPRILAEAGILNGKKATAFSTQEEPLKALGAIWTGKDIEKDENIITANGPDSATEFGIALAEMLEGME